VNNNGIAIGRGYFLDRFCLKTCLPAAKVATVGAVLLAVAGCGEYAPIDKVEGMVPRELGHLTTLSHASNLSCFASAIRFDGRVDEAALVGTEPTPRVDAESVRFQSWHEGPIPNEIMSGLSSDSVAIGVGYNCENGIRAEVLGASRDDLLSLPLLYAFSKYDAVGLVILLDRNIIMAFGVE